MPHLLVSPFTLHGQILCRIPMRRRIHLRYHPPVLSALLAVFYRPLRNQDFPISCKKNSRWWAQIGIKNISIIDSLDGSDVIDVNKIEYACLVSESRGVIHIWDCQYRTKSCPTVNVGYHKPGITDLASWSAESANRSLIDLHEMNALDNLVLSGFTVSGNNTIVKKYALT